MNFVLGILMQKMLAFSSSKTSVTICKAPETNEITIQEQDIDQVLWLCVLIIYNSTHFVFTLGLFLQTSKRCIIRHALKSLSDINLCPYILCTSGLLQPFVTYAACINEYISE